MLAVWCLVPGAQQFASATALCASSMFMQPSITHCYQPRPGRHQYKHNDNMERNFSCAVAESWAGLSLNPVLCGDIVVCQHQGFSHRSLPFPLNFSKTFTGTGVVTRMFMWLHHVNIYPVHKHAQSVKKVSCPLCKELAISVHRSMSQEKQPLTAAIYPANSPCSN